MYRFGQFLSKTINRSLLNHIYQNGYRNELSRTLFSPAALNLIEFEESRKNFLKTIKNADEFKMQMEKKLEDKEYLIFIDDFKKLIKVCDKEEDFNLLKLGLSRYNDQTKRLSFGTFHFGPEILRLCCSLNLPLVALDLVNNEEYNKVFFTHNTYWLLMDLLFKNEMYNEVKNCFENFVEKQIEAKKYSSNLFTLYCASIYKINTKEALENGLNFLKSFINEFIPFKCFWLLAKLAINCEEYVTAFEILAKLPKSSITVNLKAMIYLKTKRYNEVLFELKNFLFNDESVRKALFVTFDVMNELEKEFANCDDATLSGNFKKLKEEIIAHKLLSEKTLECFLFEVINLKPKSNFVQQPRKKSKGF